MNIKVAVFTESEKSSYTLYRDVSSRQNNWELSQNRDLLCVGTLLEVRHVIFYTRWAHSVVCDDPFD